MAGGSYIGLDIGSNLIKVAEVRKGGKGFEVVSLDLAPTPQEAFDNNMVVDPKALGAAVKALLKKAGIGGAPVVSSVSGQQAVVVRVIDVPQMNAADLAETMKWEVERQVPFSAAEVVMDYQPIERPEGYAEGQNMDVCLAVAQEEVIDRHVEMLTAAGLKCKGIDVEPLASARALLHLNAPDATPGHTVAIINIGASNTDVAVFRDKLIAFPRSLSIAGDHLTRAIANELRVDLATAEQMKRDVGEVIMGQSAPQDNFGGFGAPDFGTPSGFMDFGAVDPAAPAPYVDPAAPTAPATGPTSSPSGRMPFEFSEPAVPAPNPFDFSQQEAEPAAPDFGAGFAPLGGTPDNAPLGGGAGVPDFGTGAPTPVDVPDANLPVAPATTDPNREALRINVFNAIAPVLAELVQEVRRSLDYYRTKTGDAPIHELLLVGGTSKLRNLDAFLQEQLGVPARVVSPLENLPVIAKNQSPDYLKDIAPLFTVAIGLGAYHLVPLDPAAVRRNKASKSAPKKAKQPAA